jgi:quinone-modifying oxidoreductase subunit QmoC
VEASAAPKPAVRLEPDLEFIRTLSERGGDTLKKCFQCGTCSAACMVSPDTDPFPRKEMAWAVWGMKDRLLRDPDVWLCHQCSDCSTRCPRGARPGDVLAAVRQEAVEHYAFPRFLARWARQPQAAPLLLGIPMALLTLALLLRGPIEDRLGISKNIGERIVFAYSSVFPHWLLNTFFAFFSLLALLALVVGVSRFWRAMANVPENTAAGWSKGLVPSILSTLRSVIAHDKFAVCTTSRSRLLSHSLVFFGFLALSVVTTWVITAQFNPLIRGGFIYPFSFWSPWKLLANAGGAALVIGCLLMIRERLRDSEQVGSGTYFDWALLANLILVALTGYITEVLHYLRLEPHRHIAYFVHLVFVFAVLIYLPYSKLAHLVYRGAAMVFAERHGREASRVFSSRDAGKGREQEVRSDVGNTATEP